LPEGLAGSAWEPSKLPNYVSITPPSKTVVSLSLSLPPLKSSEVYIKLYSKSTEKGGTTGDENSPLVKTRSLRILPVLT
jgi:hypothetical protein